MAIALADHIVVDAHLSTADREVLLALKLECENYGSPAHKAGVLSQGKASLSSRLLRCYISVAQGIVRHNADVVMLTHLVLYFATSVPSAVLLFYHFTWPHAIVHLLMQLWYMPAYNLLMHQHIHQRGLLQPAFGSFDELFPYVLGPLMGHTWNSYYFHHVKHHHVEGNGPRDLSSTLRYRRDSAAHFAHYFAAFFLGTWVRLPLYFARRRQWANAARMFAWETASMALIAASVAARPRPAVFALLLPCMLLRLGLMLGNWGQHAFIDPDKPNSDFRSSLTLIDVTSGRHCFNDGYHTSHHLNSRLHWRQHPLSFMQQLDRYGQEHAIVLHNIDFLMIAIRLFMKDYEYLAKCMIPIGDQMKMNLQERMEYLRCRTRQFSEAELQEHFSSTYRKR
ncbi:hypothetical protein P8C59_008950 [Phyllachora maydis]|uniref:Fatty acid desaturase domain-containing protein n=1 Tax=Phyllachora maydis TaxID=1825666 RepID=A0AAD9IBM7_9PEZI|nr:hypothetical protein P8C59_008950 [Phyllachora maydis]